MAVRSAFPTFERFQFRIIDLLLSMVIVGWVAQSFANYARTYVAYAPLLLAAIAIFAYRTTATRLPGWIQSGVNQTRASNSNLSIQFTSKTILISIAVLAFVFQIWRNYGLFDVMIATVFAALGIAVILQVIKAIAGVGGFESIPTSARISLISLRTFGLGLLIYSLFYNRVPQYEDPFGFTIPIPAILQLSKNAFPFAILLCVVPIWHRKADLHQKRIQVSLKILCFSVLGLAAVALLASQVASTLVSTQDHARLIEMSNRTRIQPSEYERVSPLVWENTRYDLGNQVTLGVLAFTSLLVGLGLAIYGIKTGRHVFRWSGAFVWIASLIGCCWFVCWFWGEGVSMMSLSWQEGIQTAINQLPIYSIAIVLFSLLLVFYCKSSSRQIELDAGTARKIGHRLIVLVPLLGMLLLWISPANFLFTSSKLFQKTSLMETHGESFLVIFAVIMIIAASPSVQLWISTILKKPWPKRIWQSISPRSQLSLETFRLWLLATVILIPVFYTLIYISPESLNVSDRWIRSQTKLVAKIYGAFQNEFMAHLIPYSAGAVIGLVLLGGIYALPKTLVSDRYTIASSGAFKNTALFLLMAISLFVALPMFIGLSFAVGWFI